jgi:hypothetical protein
MEDQLHTDLTEQNLSVETSYVSEPECHDDEHDTADEGGVSLNMHYGTVPQTVN